MIVLWVGFKHVVELVEVSASLQRIEVKSFQCPAK